MKRRQGKRYAHTTNHLVVHPLPSSPPIHSARRRFTPSSTTPAQLARTITTVCDRLHLTTRTIAYNRLAAGQSRSFSDSALSAITLAFHVRSCWNRRQLLSYPCELRSTSRRSRRRRLSRPSPIRHCSSFDFHRTRPPTRRRPCRLPGIVSAGSPTDAKPRDRQITIATLTRNGTSFRTYCKRHCCIIPASLTSILLAHRAYNALVVVSSAIPPDLSSTPSQPAQWIPR
jgi:hypothetical protein